MRGTYHSDGATLAYCDTGAGLPVVFLHPTPLDGEYWRPLINESAGLRALVAALRGQGGSELGTLRVGRLVSAPDPPVLSMARLAADVLNLLDHLQVRQAVFAGCSIGGSVLLE